MEYYRNLPHFHPDGASLFVTFRLHGTLPMATCRNGAAFATADGELERTTSGPDWLKQPEIAECVTEIIRQGDKVRDLYRLLAFVVMPNHVHMLIEPETTLPQITHYVKGVSARQANGLLGRTGQPFWQDESFDHWVRTKKERSNIIRYIEFNPVRANLAAEPGSYRYSSAFAG